MSDDDFVLYEPQSAIVPDSAVVILDIAQFAAATDSMAVRVRSGELQVLRKVGDTFAWHDVPRKLRTIN